MELRRKPIVFTAQRSTAVRPTVQERFNVAVYRNDEICSNAIYERRVDAECAFVEAIVRAERSVGEHPEPRRIELRLGPVLLDVARVNAPTRQ